MSASDAKPVLLVLRALKLGDLLVAVPALRGLRRAFPQHELVLAAASWLEPIVPLIGGINRLLPTPGLDDPLPPLGPVDVAVNLHGKGVESRTRLEELQPAHRLGHEAKGWPGPVWDDTLHERERWVRLLRWHGIAADADDYRLGEPEASALAVGATIVHVGAAYGSRQWPAERFAAVARRLAADGHDVVVTGGGADRPRAEEVVKAAALPETACVAGEWALDEFAAAVRAARVVITADTSAAHLASAYRTPSVVLFGPASPEQWGPPADGPHIVLTDASVRHGDPFAAEPDPAILAVLPGHVLDAVARLEQGNGVERLPGRARPRAGGVTR
ncbi:glycosyltransferase family 9 protein [Sinomonas atrocyanea]|uniref:glycosyltransferase family 9 protein n=1 Tax=Sinomonas atrocyanea TaxID=37927 RepID=UPI003D9903D6